MPAWKGIVGQMFSADDFAAYVAALAFGAWRPQFVVLHNTQVPSLADWPDVDGERRMLGLESYYRDDQHWSGGPHLFIAPEGIWTFTPLTVPGVHSPSWNAISWGVELVGDYDREAMDDDVLSNGLAAIATLHRCAVWPDTRLRLHKDDPATTHDYCPGKNVRREQWEAGVQTILDLDR